MEPKDLRDEAIAITLALNETGLLDMAGRTFDIPLLIIETHLRRLIPEKCNTSKCSNEGRYNSGFCGICDVMYNRGEGIRKSDLNG